jgi:hypothetical protein
MNPVCMVPQTLALALTCAPEGCAPPADVPAAAAPPAGASRSLSIDEVVLLRRMLPLLPASPVCTRNAHTMHTPCTGRNHTVRWHSARALSVCSCFWGWRKGSNIRVLLKLSGTLHTRSQDPALCSDARADVGSMHDECE